MRNRFHKEPINKENVVRPDQAGTKENPDYVVNIAGELDEHSEKWVFFFDLNSEWTNCTRRSKGELNQWFSNEIAICNWRRTKTIATNYRPAAH